MVMPSRDIDIALKIKAANERALTRITKSLNALTKEIRSGDKSSQAFGAKINKMNAGIKQVTANATAAAGATSKLNANFVTSIVKGNLAAQAISRIAAAVKEAAISTPIYAARTQTLGVVIDQLSKANNLGVGAVQAQTEAIKKQGISIQHSREVVAKMIFAQLDLAKSTRLARLAQDAAVISGKNSSDALASIVHGIVTRQVEILRTSGIIVTFEDEFVKAARNIGRALTAQEKTQIAFDIVLERGSVIAGSYEAAMSTVHKRMTSLPRLFQDAKGAVGEHFIPVLGRTVLLLEDLAKWTEKNASTVSNLAEAFTALGGAAAGAKLGSTLGPWGTAIGGLIGGAGGFALGQYLNDPYAGSLAIGNRVITSVQERRDRLKAELSPLAQGPDGLIPNPDLPTDAAEIRRLQKEYERIPEVINERVAAVAKAYAEAIIRDVGSSPVLQQNKTRALFAGGSHNITSDVKLSRGDVLLALQRLNAGPDANDGSLAPDFSKMIAEAAALERSTNMKKVEEDIARLQSNMLEAALEPSVRFIYEAQEAARRAKEKGGSLAQQQQILQLILGSGALKILKSAKPEAPFGFGDSPGASSVNLGPSVLPFSVLAAAAGPLKERGVADDPAIGARANKEAEAIGKDFIKRRAESFQRAAEFQMRIVELLAGPGGEIEAINRASTLREAAALREFQHTQDRAQYEKATDDARHERVISLLELQRRSLQEFQQNLGAIFDAINTNGKVGVQDFFKGQLTAVKRQLFINFGSEAFSTVQGKLAIPGQQKAGGGLTFLGRLLKNTPFGVDPSADIDRKQLEAQLATVAAVDNLTKVVSNGGGSGLPTIGPGGALIPGSAASLVNAVSAASGGGNSFLNSIQGFGGGAASVLTAGLFAGLRPGDRSIQTGPGRATTQSELGATSKAGRIGNITASGAAAAAAGFGIYSGLKQGGKEGITTAVTSGLGAAALIPGVQQPFIQTAAMLTGIISSFIGTSEEARQKRHTEILGQLEKNRVSARVGDDRLTDLTGNEIDFDSAGKVRTIVMQNITVPISAMDSKSFLDRAGDISRAVSHELNSGNNDLRTAVQEASFS